MDDAAPRTQTAAMSREEKAIRVDLAACYRLIADYGWDDIQATHISAAIPGEEAFLINPFGMLFEEITASSLVKVGLDGEILAETPYQINAAGFTIHSAVHQVRKDAGCVIHLHTPAGMAVSTLEEGLLPLTQNSAYMLPDVAYHEYEGVALDLDERERLQADLGERNLMILRNHGTLAVGRSVADAFMRIYMLEKTCLSQTMALGMGRPIHPIAADVLAKVDGQARKMRGSNGGGPRLELTWQGLLNRLDRRDPGYRN